MKQPIFQTLSVAFLLGGFAFLSARGARNFRSQEKLAQAAISQTGDTRANLAWMRQRLALSDDEFAKECSLHEAYIPECRRLAAEMTAARARLKAALQNEAPISAEGQATIRDYEVHFEACERAAIRHAKDVAAAMNPKAGRAYLQMTLPHLFPDHISVLQAAAPTPSRR